MISLPRLVMPALALFVFGNVCHAQTPATSPLKVKPDTYRFGDLATNVLSPRLGTRLSVDEKKEVSGVSLYTSLDGVRPEDAKEALASFFSHKGAISRWGPVASGEAFLLSPRYHAGLGQAHWNDKIIALFDDVLKHQNDSPEQIEQLKDQRSLYTALRYKIGLNTVQFMASAFTRGTLEKILRGEISQTVSIDSMVGQEHQAAMAVYNHVRPEIFEATITPQMTVQMRRVMNDKVGSLWITVKGKVKEGRVKITQNGLPLPADEMEAERYTELGGNVLSLFAEQEAEEEAKNFWLIPGDKPVDIPERVNPEVPSTDAKIPTGNYSEKFQEISKRFQLPVIAVLPNAITTKTLRVSTLPETLRMLSDNGEPMVFKMRNGILLACPASFLGDDGVTNAMPLATVHALQNITKNAKEGYPSLLEYTRIIEPLSDNQVARNAGEFQPLSLVQKWRVLLRAVLRNETATRQWNAHEDIVMDERLASAANVVLRADDKGIPGGLQPGQKLRIDELGEVSYLTETPPDLPRDLLMMREVTITATNGMGKNIVMLRGYYTQLNPKYASGIPDANMPKRK